MTISTSTSDTNVFDAVIEIAAGGEPVKYELNKMSGSLRVDRFLHTSMRYPCNYGFIPETLSRDGDPCDVLALTPAPVVPGAIILCRPLGVLLMEDEHGPDEKILAVPVQRLTHDFDGIQDVSDLPRSRVDLIEHFFAHYKDLEPGKWVKIERWGTAGEASRMIAEARRRVSLDGMF